MTTTERLMKAKELLVRDGWIIKYLSNEHGHCALGAIYDADGSDSSEAYIIWALGKCEFENRYKLSLACLLQAIGGAYYSSSSAVNQIANYNNSRGSIKEILAWFDRAIELAQAAEMHRELESAVPVVAEREEEVKGELVRA